jgi:hypothetical protein
MDRLKRGTEVPLKHTDTRRHFRLCPMTTITVCVAAGDNGSSDGRNHQRGRMERWCLSCIASLYPFRGSDRLPSYNAKDSHGRQRTPYLHPSNACALRRLETPNAIKSLEFRDSPLSCRWHVYTGALDRFCCFMPRQAAMQVDDPSGVLRGRTTNKGQGGRLFPASLLLWGHCWAL